MAPVTYRFFFDRTTPFTRFILGLGAVSGAVNLATFFEIQWESLYGMPYLLHLIVMGVGFATFIQIGYHHYLWTRTGGGPTIVLESRVPVSLIVGTGVVFLYVLCVVLWFGTASGGGSAELRDRSYVWVVGEEVARSATKAEYDAYQTGLLRAFSSVWLFFALTLGIVWHKVGHRIRAMQAESGGRV